MKKVIVMTGIVFAISFSAFYFWSQGPSVQNLTTTEQGVLGADTNSQLKQIANDYFKMLIPARYELKTSSNIRPPVFLQQLYSVHARTAAQLSSDQLAITVGDLQKQSINDLSAVQLRWRNPVYSAVDLGLGPNSISFESTEHDYEISTFVENKGVYVAFVQTVNVQNKANALVEFKQSIQSLSWR